MSKLERFALTNRHSTKSRRERPLPKPRPAPLQSTAEDVQSRSLFGRQRDIIMNQLLSPNIRHFSFDGSGLPFARRSPSPRTSSNESLSSESGSRPKWDKTTLLDLSDRVRHLMKHEKSLEPENSNLKNFLEDAVKDEMYTDPALDFACIENAHLDKLVQEVIEFARLLKDTNYATVLHLGYWVMVAQVDKLQDLAAKLQNAWRQRFLEQYLFIDNYRTSDLVRTGRLREVSFNNDLTYDLGKWQTKETKPISELEGHLQFEAGHWWLNLACAQRDGIVTSSVEKPASGRYGITTLPLLTGREEVINENGVELTKYIRFGRSSDMHIPLISQVGKQIRVLRGYRLRSIYAPEAGIRYEGLYTIRQYGTKLDIVSDTYRLELKLQRVLEQRPMDELKRIPKPSQLDDWALYQKLEGNEMKRIGNAKYMEWNIQMEEERLDRESWRRDREFRASFT
ncbi:Peptidyl-prolyl cis-trans isomerase pin4 [Apiospora marii]|uniref:Peptidyl-prolyl cis-trans isomerase pin4 n=1 Tax=Apiospora marii TaxID=335849 RepID=A0ABR1RM55_9PEZI